MVQEAFELAIARVARGEHIVPVLNQSFFHAFRNAPTFEVRDERGLTHVLYYYNIEHPEAAAMRQLWKQEGGVVGTDFFQNYTPEQSVQALEKLRDSVLSGGFESHLPK